MMTLWFKTEGLLDQSENSLGILNCEKLWEHGLSWNFSSYCIIFVKHLFSHLCCIYSTESEICLL